MASKVAQSGRGGGETRSEAKRSHGGKRSNLAGTKGERREGE
jgi:hypothetical protein